PARRGSVYMRTDVSTLIRFKAAYVSGPYRAAVTRRQRQEAVRQLVVPYAAGYLTPREPVNSEPEEPAVPEGADPLASGSEAQNAEGGQTLLEVMVDRLTGKSP